MGCGKFMMALMLSSLLTSHFAVLTLPAMSGTTSLAFARAFSGMTAVMAGLSSLALAVSLLSLRWGSRELIGGGGSSGSLRGLVGHAKELSSSRGGSEVELEDLERHTAPLGWRSKVPPRPEL